jgi:uncharacterized protein (DUF1330 family)
MLNLIRFRDEAAYPEGHELHGAGLSGKEAYALYKQGIRPVLERLGGGFVWQGPLECVVTGPAGEWDEAFVMGFPSAAAFMEMVKDPGYSGEVVVHRTAAVEDSRLIRFGV